MNVWRKRSRRFRFWVLVGLMLGLIVAASGAQAAPGGTVVAWGCGSGADWGQCNVPGDLSDVIAISAGYMHSLALRSDGTVVAWGCETENEEQCDVPRDLSGVTAIAAGGFHSLALKHDGTVVAWGCGDDDDFGQCNVPSGLSGVTAIAAGGDYSLAVKSDGTVVAWGCGGGAAPCAIPSGLRDVTAIASGGDGIVQALKSDGTVVSWGICGSRCAPPSPLSGVVAVAAGFAHSLALKSDGTVVAWDYSGWLDVPSGLARVTAIAAGAYNSLALKSDGTVAAWGCDVDFGQCDVPTGLRDATAIAGGLAQSLAIVAQTNRPPDCATVTATPHSIWPQTRDQFKQITLSGATDPDGDVLSYHIDGVTQDEYVTGVGDDTFPDAALAGAGADSNEVLVRIEANSHFNGRVYRIAYTVSDGRGGTCSGTAGPVGTTTATAGVQRKRDTAAIDDGGTNSWKSFMGARVP